MVCDWNMMWKVLDLMLQVATGVLCRGTKLADLLYLFASSLLFNTVH